LVVVEKIKNGEIHFAIKQNVAAKLHNGKGKYIMALLKNK
jgi:hypothetical protein